MKINRFLFLIPTLLFLSSCSEKEPDEPSKPGDENTQTPSKPGSSVDYVDPNAATDLSAEEMANCYIVQKSGNYKFKADNQFNLGAGLPVPPHISPVSAKLLWQTVKGSISTVTFNNDNPTNPYIEFEVNEPKGNAIIAALDEAGEIVWSWHIWMPTEEITSIHSSTGYDVMNLNLGALNNQAGDASSYGMLYQWGRKDPFPASETLTGTTATVSAPMYDINNEPIALQYSNWGSVADNTIEYSIANPTTVMSNYAQYALSRDWLNSQYSDDSLWGNPLSSEDEADIDLIHGRKTCYDPSPAGWRVADPKVFSHFTTSGGYAWVFEDFNVADTNPDGVLDLNDYNYGWHFMINENTPLYFPAAARFDGSYAMLMGSVSGVWGNYWSNAPYPTIPGGAYCCLAFQVKDQVGNDMTTVSPSAGGSRADAYSIRCVRDN